MTPMREGKSTALRDFVRDADSPEWRADCKLGLDRVVSKFAMEDLHRGLAHVCELFTGYGEDLSPEICAAEIDKAVRRLLSAKQKILKPGSLGPAPTKSEIVPRAKKGAKKLHRAGEAGV
jgi:hypothetical protein